jgi:hypothetical protein
MRRGAAGVLVWLSCAAGCDVNDPSYYPGARPLEVGATPSDPAMMPLSSDTDQVVIPFRVPTASEQKTLDATSAQRGYTVPWLGQGDIAIEVVYVVRNVDTMAGTARVEITGADEFTNYDLAVVAAAQAGLPEKDQVVLPLISAIPIMLAPGASYQGVVREDDFAEAELDLDAMGRWMAVPAEVLINRSEVNPIGLEMVPKDEIVPALFKVAVTLSADVHMTCTYLVRVRDRVGRLWDGTGAQLMPTPADYTPPPITTGN